MAMLKWRWLVVASLVLGCAGQRPGHPGAPAEQRTVAYRDSRRTTEPLKAPSKPQAAAAVLAQFEGFLQQTPDLEYPELLSRLGIVTPKESSLGFDPTRVKYFDQVSAGLRMTAEEQRVYRQHGLVSVDHRRPLSMANVYHAIYTMDLPVLITTDSILHALHRSFDKALMDLESSLFLPLVDAALARSSEELARAAHASRAPELRKNFEDVDLYFTVARNLLAGAGAAENAAPATIAPKLVEAEAVDGILKKVASLTLEERASTSIYGGRRAVDWSQFRPRGHYAHSARLSNFFRAMLWLGRTDLGWTLRTPDPAAGLDIDPERERADAALAVLLLQQSGELEHLSSVSRIIDFMVGRADNVTIDQVGAALAAAKIRQSDQLAEPEAMARFDAALGESPPGVQQIRGQVLGADLRGTVPTALPLSFQVFGQRFVIDSFVLSRVVFDSIVFDREKQPRMLPSGLDVMAALGNDTAVRLLAPELKQYKYSSNLLAARRVVDAITPEEWNQTAYNQWLSTLRTLDDPPESAAHFPASLKGEAWRRKQLRTALASWTELRHDTILYAKQSYSSTACEYPSGYVEPYPAFFRRVRELTATLSTRLGSIAEATAEPAKTGTAARGSKNAVPTARDRLQKFFARFASTMERLERLAALELSAQPFSADDEAFLKKTIDRRGAGSGPPRYDGWYPELILGERPDLWQPVVADVHTDPNGPRVLHEGVGNAEFLVVAIDNGPHRAAYVGPSYSYFEFTRGARMTDEEWQTEISRGTAPPPPGFTRIFQVPGTERLTLPASR
jgi:hypothetical protein